MAVSDRFYVWLYFVCLISSTVYTLHSTVFTSMMIIILRLRNYWQYLPPVVFFTLQESTVCDDVLDQYWPDSSVTVQYRVCIPNKMTSYGPASKKKKTKNRQIKCEIM